MSIQNQGRVYGSRRTRRKRCDDVSLRPSPQDEDEDEDEGDVYLNVCTDFTVYFQVHFLFYDVIRSRINNINNCNS